MVQADSGVLETVLRGWQQKGVTLAIHSEGPGMRVVLSGKLRASKQGTWVIGNGRAGFVFDAHYATGQVADPTVVPDLVRECISGEFVTALELLLETGDACWLGEVRRAETATASV